ncbi:MAG: MBL fold metallo-hydrolase [Actinobacteria bacterium]|nr:MBL fold metallo-hydrolase [Actinomycetota bacterium]
MIIRGGTFGPVATNTYVVADRPGGTAIVVDPAMGGAAWVRDTLQRLDVTPIAVWDTHGHWDHVVENHVWADAGLPIWCGLGDEAWIQAPTPFNPALFGNPPPTPGVTPSRVLTDGDTFEVGALTFDLLHTPGHSPGCYVAIERANGHALVGDLIFAQGIGRTDFPGSDHTAMVASLERVLRELPGETLIYPGHGPWEVTLADAGRFVRMFI